MKPQVYVVLCRTESEGVAPMDSLEVRYVFEGRQKANAYARLQGALNQNNRYLVVNARWKGLIAYSLIDKNVWVVARKGWEGSECRMYIDCVYQSVERALAAVKELNKDRPFATSLYEAYSARSGGYL